MPAKKAAKKATAKKATAKKTTAKKAAANKPAKTAKKVAAKIARKSMVRPSTEAIARLAYLNYLHRMDQGLPGDSESDWVEAERALLEE